MEESCTPILNFFSCIKTVHKFSASLIEMTPRGCTRCHHEWCSTLYLNLFKYSFKYGVAKQHEYSEASPLKHISPGKVLTCSVLVSYRLKLRQRFISLQIHLTLTTKPPGNSATEICLYESLIKNCFIILIYWQSGRWQSNPLTR